MKAAVLAAGEGNRLWPLTRRRPKPMLPVANRPLLEYVIEAIADAGIDEIVLVVGYQRDRIQTYFEDGDAWGVDIEYVTQETQLGTGHAVAQLEGHMTEEFLVLNGDRLLEPSLITQVMAAATDDVAATVGITPVEEPQRYGVVSTDGDTLLDIDEKPAGEVASDIINAGVYHLSPRIFEILDLMAATPDGELSLPRAITELATEDTVRAARYRGTWLDVSQLWDLLAINDAVLAREDSPIEGTHHDSAVVGERVCSRPDTRVGRNATVMRGTALGSNVSVGAGAVVTNTIVFDDVTIQPGAVVRDCIIGENATIGANATVGGGRSSLVVDGTVYDDVALGAVIGDRTRVGSGAVIEPGTVIGDGTTVADGVVLAGRIDANSTIVRG